VTTLIIIIHIIVCIVLIMAVLLQSGKSADLAGAFGGVGSQTAFGARGSATLMSKITTACAILFMFTSLGLWILSARGTKSVLSGESAPEPAATEPAAKKEEPKAAATEAPVQPEEKGPTSEPIKK
jgi:preprotein translocase subunit SecG